MFLLELFEIVEMEKRTLEWQFCVWNLEMTETFSFREQKSCNIPAVPSLQIAVSRTVV